jgi:adenosine kinase
MNIVLTGSIAYDYLMTFPGYFRDHILPDHLDSISLSFLVDSMVRLRGGVAPNIAYTLALLGERPRLFATVGEDFDEYRAWLESLGVDTQGVRVIPGVYTASFFANTDKSNTQISSFYPGAMAYAGQLSMREVLPWDPDLVLICPNDPDAMSAYVRECQELGMDYAYDPSQQVVRLSAEDLRCGVLGAAAVFVNEYEFFLIQKNTGLQPEEILQRSPSGRSLNGGRGPFLVVTEGEKGATIYAGGEQWHVPVVPPEQILDPTGVGDAFRGGFLSGFGHALDWQTCGQMGALAATYCLEQRGPQGHSYTPQEFVARYRQHFDDQGRLDFLLETSNEEN